MIPLLSTIIIFFFVVLHLQSASSFILQPNHHVTSTRSRSSFSISSPPSPYNDNHVSPSSTSSTSSSSTTTTTRLFMEMMECDVVIVGGGPAGCTCALYTSRAELKTIIVDKNPTVGALAITSHIANYPGVDRSMTGQELLDQMRVQAVQYGTEYIQAQVFMIDIMEDEEYSKIVYTPDVTVKAKALVLATGAMGRAGNPFPGEEKYLGQGVSYCATCDGAFYRDAEVCVFGATNEAIDEAMFLTKFASTVHWITATDLERCLQIQGKSTVECNKIVDEHKLEQLLSQDNVKHWPKTRLLGVEGDVSGVTGVKVQKMYSDKEKIIPVEGAFIYGAGGGSKPITDFVQNKVEFKEDGGVIVNEDMETSVKGVFAIGDIRNTHFKQVVVAAADGCIAAMSIDKYIKGRKSIKVDWIHK